MSFYQINNLQIRGLRIWSETVEKAHDMDLELLRLSYSGALLQYSEVKLGKGLSRIVETWATKEALIASINVRQSKRLSVNVREFLSELDGFIADLDMNSF